MLSPKPWKPDAVARLVVSVFICIFAGSLLISVAHFTHRGIKGGIKFYSLVSASFAFLAATLVLIRLRWRLENFMRRMLLLLGCFYVGLFLGMWAQELAWPVRPDVPSSGQMLVTVLSFQGAALLFVALFLREHQMSWSDGFGFRQETMKSLLLGVLAACLFLPLGWRLQTASADWLAWASHHLHSALPNFTFKVEEQVPVQTLRSSSSWAARIALGVLTILIVPVAEEILFRGILYPLLKQRGFPGLALVGTSILFAAMHLNLVTFIPLFVLALVLTLLYEWTNNLLAPIIAHALFNGLNFAVLFLVEKHPLGK
jgi:membrane protease YdiL (CAAX protease family)